MDINEGKIKILEATIRVFNEKGMKFTMDDIAKELSMSKKTIYTIFRDKDSIFSAMVDYCFDNIKESENLVLNDDSLSTVEKLRKMLGVLPESYMNIDFRQLFLLKDKFPKIYAKVEERLESGWEGTIRLMEQGMEEGSLRPFNVILFKATFEASIEQFFRRDILTPNGITYQDALRDIVGILIDGIATDN